MKRPIDPARVTPTGTPYYVTGVQPAHTPGPWTYQPTAGKHDFAIYPESTGRDLALVRDFNEANARLIAAAPELLGALNEVVADVLVGRRPNLVTAATALAKAEGRTP